MIDRRYKILVKNEYKNSDELFKHLNVKKVVKQHRIGSVERKSRKELRSIFDEKPYLFEPYMTRYHISYHINWIGDAIITDRKKQTIGLS